MSWTLIAAGLLVTGLIPPPEEEAAPAGSEGYLGAHTTTVSLLEEDPDKEEGIAVTRVVENSPAEAAGVRVGDRLLSLDAVVLRSSRQLEALVAARPPGTEVALEVRRGEAVLSVRARLVARLRPRTAPPVARYLEDRRLGARVATLSTGEAEAEGIPPGEGVRVLSFYPGSSLETAGVELDDVIWALEGEPIYGGEDFIRRARALEPDRKIDLLVSRGGERHTIRARTTDRSRSLHYFHFPGIVIYESDARKEDATFGLLLNIFKYTRHEDERTYRILYIIKWTTGDNEELRRVEP